MGKKQSPERCAERSAAAAGVGTARDSMLSSELRAMSPELARLSPRTLDAELRFYMAGTEEHRP